MILKFDINNNELLRNIWEHKGGKDKKIIF